MPRKMSVPSNVEHGLTNGNDLPGGPRHDNNLKRCMPSVHGLLQEIFPLRWRFEATSVPHSNRRDVDSANGGILGSPVDGSTAL